MTKEELCSLLTEIVEQLDIPEVDKPLLVFTLIGITKLADWPTETTIEVARCMSPGTQLVARALAMSMIMEMILQGKV